MKAWAPLTSQYWFSKVLIIFIFALCQPIWALTFLMDETLSIEGRVYRIESELGRGSGGIVYKLSAIDDPLVAYALRVPILGVGSEQDEIYRVEIYESAVLKLRNIPSSEKMLRWLPRLVNVTVHKDWTPDRLQRELGWTANGEIRLSISPLASYNLESFLKSLESNPEKTDGKDFEFVQDRFKLLKSTFKRVFPEISWLFSHDYVHNDIKPENILIGERRTMGLTDFETTNKFGEPVGGATKSYAPPERLIGIEERVLEDHPVSDAYSFGKTLSRILFSTLEWSNLASEQDRATGRQQYFHLAVRFEELWRQKKETILKSKKKWKTSERRLLDLISACLRADPVDRLVAIKKVGWFDTTNWKNSDWLASSLFKLPKAGYEPMPRSSKIEKTIVYPATEIMSKRIDGCHRFYRTY